VICLHANAPPTEGGRRSELGCAARSCAEAQPAQTSVGENFRTSIAAGRTAHAAKAQQYYRIPGTAVEALSSVSDLLDLDLDVDAGGEVEPLERLDGLRRGLDDVDKALVDAHLEVFARVLVDVG
jgi:hypothetical protein